ncbi:MAG: hypothetical protein ACYTG2_18335 [Planctomycetota bacterium]|jgi:hypothetical protein
MRSVRTVVLSMLVMALLAGPAAATTIVRLSVEDMTQRATHVVHGTVSAVHASRAPGGRIYTYVTLEVQASPKGEASTSLTFVQLGGRIGDLACGVVGAPTFEVGEELVVFLLQMTPRDALEDGVDLWLLGLGQGKWSVTTDAADGTRRATIDLSGVKVVTKPGRTYDDALPLDTLIERVRGAAEAGR